MWVSRNIQEGGNVERWKELTHPDLVLCFPKMPKTKQTNKKNQQYCQRACLLYIEHSESLHYTMNGHSLTM